MDNRDLIIKIARRLDKFSLDEIITLSELRETEVQIILSALIKENIILKTGENYCFNSNNTTKKHSIKNFARKVQQIVKPIIIEEQDGYDYFLTLPKSIQFRIRGYVALINLLNNTGKRNVKQVIDFFNQTSEYNNIPYPTFVRIRANFKRYGFKGILPRMSNYANDFIPNELYDYFKKYYLSKEKLTAPEALYQAQTQLQYEQKIEQPTNFSPLSFVKRLKSEFKKEQIEYFRNTINPPKRRISAKVILEPLDMLFKDAAEIYFNRLKADNKLEKLMHQKTDYKNHLEDYFGYFKIEEITNNMIAAYKQKEFDNGCQLASVNIYIMALRNIVQTVCPYTNKLTKRKQKLEMPSYAINMNILSDRQITLLLQLCKEKYNSAYPIVYIALSSGAKVAELLGLTWDRINFETKTIFLKYFLYGNKLVMNKPGSTMRTLKIDDEICSVLQKKFDDYNPPVTNYVFNLQTEKLLQQYFEEDVLKPLSEELNIRKFYPSDLQHNFVNLCLKQNIPLTFIQKAIGLYNLTTFIKTYKPLIVKLEKDYYNPLEILKVV